MQVSASDFKVGMRRLAAAVSVITTAREQERSGMTATAVMSLTAEPPQLLVALNKSASSLALIEDSGCFAVNVLSMDQRNIARVFSGEQGHKGAARFSAGIWRSGNTGAPLLNDAYAAFDCRVANIVDVGTHVLLIGIIQTIEASRDERPLLYLDGSWASLGRAYEDDFRRYKQAMIDSVAILDEAARDADPIRQFKIFVQKFAHINMSQAQTTRAFFNQERNFLAAELDEINALKLEFDRKLRKMLAKGADAGAFKIHDPQITGLAITGMMLWMHRWYHQDGRLEADVLAQQIMNLSLGLIGQSPPPS